jgi:hypothetical protein
MKTLFLVELIYIFKWTDRTILDQVLEMDANAIDALLLAVLQDHAQYRNLVKRRDREAQSLLNLLQAVSLFLTVICQYYYIKLTQ